MNYDYFYDRIQKQEIAIDELYNAICCLEIINIRLDMDDNPQLIFESLNLTGLDLSEGDKIRNFILMGLPSKEQEDYYEKYWNKIEVCTNGTAPCGDAGLRKVISDSPRRQFRQCCS